MPNNDNAARGVLGSMGGNMRSLESALLKHGSVNAFRAAAPLPRNTQELIDKAVVRVGMDRLTIVADLLAEGLIYDLPNWLSVLMLYHERSGRAGHAQRTMIPKARGERQVEDRLGIYLPVYATWDDFSFNIREILASERVGAPLETSHVEGATRNVNEAIEDQCINGAGFNVDGNSAPGLLTSPLNTVAYTGNEAWDAVGHTGEEILADVMSMIDAAQADRYFGPYNLYIPTTYGTKLFGTDFKANSSDTIQSRLEQINVGGRPLRIRVADMLPANRTALVQMTSNVIDVVVGQTPTEISWEDGPGLERFFMVLACMIVRVKYDYSNKSGIVIGNTT